MEILYCDSCRSRVSEGELTNGTAVSHDDRVYCARCVRKSEELQLLRTEQRGGAREEPRQDTPARPKKYSTTTARAVTPRQKRPAVALGVAAGAIAFAAMLFVWMATSSSNGNGLPKLSRSPSRPALLREADVRAEEPHASSWVSPAKGSALSGESVEALPPAPSPPEATEARDEDPSSPVEVPSPAPPKAAGAPDSDPNAGPARAMAAIRRGVQAVGADDLLAAENAFREALGHEPDSAVGHNNLAAVLIEQGRLKDAEERLTRAIELEPGLAEAHLNLGFARAAQWRYREASDHLRKGLGLEPGRGSQVKKVLDQIDALHLEELGERGPENIAQALWLARKRMREKNWSAALTALGKAGEFDAESADVKFLKGLVYEEQSRPARAIGAYLQAVRLDPRHFRALNNVAWIYVTAPNPPLKNPSLALRYAKKANAICGGENAVVLDTLARSLDATGDRGAALKAAAKAVKLSPNDEEIARFLEKLRNGSKGA